MRILLALLLLPVSLSVAADDRLRAVIDDPARPAEEAARDTYRHPYETLTFFGIEPDMTVVELSPGSGWYTGILAPYLKDEGELIAAHVNLDREDIPDFYREMHAQYVERFSDDARYGNVRIIPFDPPAVAGLGEPGSADMVLTFRNVHNWIGADTFRDVLDSARAVLKPGGVLGVVGHRLPEERDQDPAAESGYVKQSLVVAQAEAAGFRLVEASEINANPADSADHPEGVWNLPPSLRVPEDEEKYRAIGESDRFTLKFVKR